MDTAKPIIDLYRTGSYGDLLMMTPLFKALQSLNYRVRYICLECYSSVLEDNPYLDRLITLPNDHNCNPDDVKRYAEQVTGEAASTFLFLKYPAWWIYPGLPTQTIHQHMVDFFASQVGISVNDELSVHLTPEMLDWAKQFSNCVLIQTKTAWSPYKNWHLDYWKELSHRIQRELGIAVLQLGHANDPGIETVPKIGTPSVRHAIAALSACRLFIGLDSVFNHASRAVKKKSIILWGSTNPAAFAYRQNINLVNGCEWKPEMGNGPPLLKCQPCYREYKHIEAHADLACPYTVVHTNPALPHTTSSVHACMAANTVSVVFSHVKKCLEASNT